jgi:hypothetical protein
MEHVLSIDGLDTNILSHLTFRELGNLRKVSTSLSSVVNILSINISKDLIEHFKKLYELSYTFPESYTLQEPKYLAFDVFIEKNKFMILEAGDDWSSTVRDRLMSEEDKRLITFCYGVPSPREPDDESSDGDDELVIPYDNRLDDADLYNIKETIFILMYKCCSEIEFIQHFITDRKPYEAFITTLEETKFNTINNSINTMIRNCENLNWIKSADNKWIIGPWKGPRKYQSIKDNKILIERKIDFYRAVIEDIIHTSCENLEIKI